jgi:four helix bundle protein
MVRFKPRATGQPEPPAAEPSPEPAAPVPPVPPVPPVLQDRVELYQQALAFAARVFTVVELAETERYHVRDQLDRKSAIVPQLIAQGLALADMKARRAIYQRAREALTDCAAILDILGERGTIEPEALTPPRELAHVLIQKLFALIAAPPRVW